MRTNRALDRDNRFCANADKPALRSSHAILAPFVAVLHAAARQLAASSSRVAPDFPICLFRGRGWQATRIGRVITAAGNWDRVRPQHAPKITCAFAPFSRVATVGSTRSTLCPRSGPQLSDVFATLPFATPLKNPDFPTT
jgi:hypothetical protein